LHAIAIQGATSRADLAGGDVGGQGLHPLWHYRMCACACANLCFAFFASGGLFEPKTAMAKAEASCITHLHMPRADSVAAKHVVGAQNCANPWGGSGPHYNFSTPEPVL